jgi:hypothetical protein
MDEKQMQLMAMDRYFHDVPYGKTYKSEAGA